MKNKTNFETTRFDLIREFLKSKNEPNYRFKQLVDGIFKQRVNEFEEIMVLPKPLRIELKQKFGSVLTVKVLRKTKSSQATKVLFGLHDGERVEMVEMDFKGEKRKWKSLCVSSQVGCALGCAFCATGKIGLKRNMTPDEIIDQVLYFHLQGSNINSISFMGMGEPLVNPAVFTAIKAFTDKNLFNFSPRRISVSTVGIVPGIKKLIKQFPQVNIAFSLQTPFERQRRELMPISKQYPIREVLAALDDHIRKNKRKVFLTYIMLKEVNDTERHLLALKKLIKSRGKTSYLYHVNLIRYNPAVMVGGRFQCSYKAKIEHFRQELEKAEINVTLRQSFGVKHQAACGQLYAEYDSVPIR